MTTAKKFYYFAFALLGATLMLFSSCVKEDGKNVPLLTTTNVTEITQTTAITGGDITDDGGATVTARGVCWSTSQNPTINDSITEDGTGAGNFISSISGLEPNTTYYVRAYATNSEGIGYGAQFSFETAGTTIIYGDGVTDIDGNDYITVIIGGQEWMAENLKTTTYSNGTAIPNITDNTKWTELSTGAYAWYENDEATYKDNYGALYNWYAVETGNLCPTGWRVPTDVEWTQLVDYVVAQGYPNSNVVGGAGNVLKSCRQVNSPLGGDCATSEHPCWNSSSTHYGTDVFGFSALPGGGRGDFGGTFHNVGGHGYWWSSTEYDAALAWYRFMNYGLGNVPPLVNNKRNGFSVRCLRDN